MELSADQDSPCYWYKLTLAHEGRGGNLEGIMDIYLHAKATIWAGVALMVLQVPNSFDSGSGGCVVQDICLRNGS